MEILPAGYKFLPTNLEIIFSYLLPKLQDPDAQSHIIVDQNIYAVTPESLNWDRVRHLNDYERYYFVKRKEKQKNTKRSLETGEGYWRKSRSDEPILDLRNRVVGDVALLNFFKYDLASKKPIKTEFIMYEFTLRSHTFQEWVVCRIKDKGREKEGMRRNLEIHNLIPHPPMDADSGDEGVTFETEDSDDEELQQPLTVEDYGIDEDRLIMFTYDELFG